MKMEDFISPFVPAQKPEYCFIDFNVLTAVSKLVH